MSSLWICFMVPVYTQDVSAICPLRKKGCSEEQPISFHSGGKCLPVGPTVFPLPLRRPEAIQQASRYLRRASPSKDGPVSTKRRGRHPGCASPASLNMLFPLDDGTGNKWFGMKAWIPAGIKQAVGYGTATAFEVLRSGTVYPFSVISFLN